MFQDQRFLALHIHQARLTLAWDVATTTNKARSGELAFARMWISEAQAAHVHTMVSFSGAGNYIPTVSQYKRAVKAFIHHFPNVKTYTPWNEPDWIYRSLSKHPKKAASFFNALHQVCHRCKVLAGDVYLPAKQLRPWIKKYMKGLHYKPYGWALHNYNDVRSHTTKQLQVLLDLTSGPIWLTEISGVERRGHWQYKNQSAKAAGRDEKFLFRLPHRFHRVARIYHYLWQGAVGAGWDSGLVSPTGQLRPAYYVVKKASR